MFWLTKAMPSYLLLLCQSDLSSDGEPTMNKDKDKTLSEDVRSNSAYVGTP